jgi:hypothetical protein
MATIHHDGSDRMPDLALGDTLILESPALNTSATFTGGDVDITGVRFHVDSGRMMLSGTPGGLYHGVVANAILMLSDGQPIRLIPRSETPIGRLRMAPVYVAVPAPRTTAETLAVAVMCGEPCGRQLVDCLIEEGVVDPESALAEKVKADTLAKVNQVINKVAEDIDAGEVQLSDYVTVRHIQRLISELA